VNYEIIFKFFDGFDLPLEIEEEDLDHFLDDLGKNKPYFTQNKLRGFWIQGEQIRYFTIRKFGEDDASKNKENCS
jgi:hypothetical protein